MIVAQRSMIGVVRGNGREPPHINRHHIDGPLITFSDGQMHWLGWRERFALAVGRIDAWSLQAKLRPDLAWIEAAQ